MIRKIVVVAFAIAIAVLGVAALVFVRPDLPRDVLVAKYSDARSRFVALPDGTVAHVRVEGAAGKPVVVLLHGAASSLQSWERWAPLLARTYRVVSIDLPGHGLTGPSVAADYTRGGMVTFVHAVLERMGIARAALAGISMGGGVAVAYAERYPGDVWALVLIDSAGIPHTADEGSGLDRLARNAVLRPVLRWVTPRWIVASGLRKAFGDPSKIDDAMVTRTVDLMRFPGNREALIGHYLATGDDAASEAGLGRVAAPTLIEWGADDHVLPLSHAREFQRRIAKARLIVYPGAGHMVIEEIPAQSERDAESFLDDVRARR